MPILWFLAIAAQGLSYSNAEPDNGSQAQRLVAAYSFEELVSLPMGVVSLRPAGVQQVASVLWKKYRDCVGRDVTRVQEHRANALHLGDKVMRYGVAHVGTAPKGGHALYIALHGGGGAPARVNDSQWEDMKKYYWRSVKEGIYVAV